jgi:hypothetical protein
MLGVTGEKEKCLFGLEKNKLQITINAMERSCDLIFTTITYPQLPVPGTLNN